MTKRVKLNPIPFNDVEVNEPVMFVSSSGINWGFYQGTYKGKPVVEYFYKEQTLRFCVNENGKNKWDGKWIRDKLWSVKSKRVVLKRRNMFGISTLKNKFKVLNTEKSLNELVALENAKIKESLSSP